MIPLRDQNPSGVFPVVTVALILVNTLVFLYEAPRAGCEHVPRALRPGPSRCDRQPSLRLGGLHGDREALFHLDVPPRRLAPPDLEHVVPLDLRRQRGGHAGAGPLPPLLSALRPGGGAHAVRGPDPI